MPMIENLIKEIFNNIQSWQMMGQKKDKKTLYWFDWLEYPTESYRKINMIIVLGSNLDPEP